MKKRMLSMLLILIIFCLSILAGCNQKKKQEDETRIETYIGNDEKVEITFSWWGSENRHQYTLDAIDSFEQLNPNIEVHCVYSAFDGYEEHLKQDIAANTMADVVTMNYSWLYTYSKEQDLFKDLSPYAEELYFSSYPEQEFMLGRMGDRILGVPTSVGASVYYYNQSIYDRYGQKIPETFEDLMEAARIMRKDQIYPLVVGPKGAYLLCLSYAEQKTGKQYMTLDGTFGFDAVDFEQMLVIYRTLVEEKAICRIEDYDRSLIRDGEAAGYFAWISDANAWEDVEIEGNQVVIGSYLKLDETKNPIWYYKPNQLYCINQNTEHVKESVKLLSFLTTSKEMMERQGTEKGMPANQIAQGHLAAEGKKDSLEVRAYQAFESYDNVEQMSYYMEDTEIVTLFKDAANQVLYDQKSSRETAECLYQDMQKVIKKKQNLEK